MESLQESSFKPHDLNVNEFRENLNERLKLGSQIKGFHHKLKIHMGNYSFINID